MCALFSGRTTPAARRATGRTSSPEARRETRGLRKKRRSPLSGIVAMAKHKAPTQVTLASLQQQTLFHDFVYRYWKLGALLAIAVSIGILIPVYTRQQARVSHHGIWDDLRSQADLGSGVFAQVQGGSPEALARFAEEHRDTQVGTWAKALEVGALVKAEKLDEAERAAGDLASTWPDHLLAKAAIFPAPDGTKHVLGDAVRSGK